MKRESNEIKKENDRAASFMRFCEVVRHLRAEDGCPWDRAQTHTSLKPYCIEEAAEVIGGLAAFGSMTGNPILAPTIPTSAPIEENASER